MLFTVPLFLLSMGMDWGLLPPFFYASTSTAHGMPVPQPWFNWLLLALAIPVQFYVGWQYYVGAFKAVRNRSANMDVLIVLGASAAFFYSLPIVFGWLEGHVYFETAAVIITLIKLGKYLEARAKGRTSEAIKKLMGLRAKTAHVVRDGTELEIPVDDVRVGDVRARPAGREDPGGWRGRRGPLGGGRIDAHRRVAAGGEEARRSGDRRDPQQARPAQVRSDEGRPGDRAGADHPPGGGSAGQQGADPEAGRPGLGRLRADRARRSPR